MYFYFVISIIYCFFFVMFWKREWGGRLWFACYSSFNFLTSACRYIPLTCMCLTPSKSPPISKSSFVYQTTWMIFLRLVENFIFSVIMFMQISIDEYLLCTKQINGHTLHIMLENISISKPAWNCCFLFSIINSLGSFGALLWK